MTGSRGFDVAIVGASVAGSSAARLFGKAGARVALIERRPEREAYKVTCTHSAISSASGTIERLGLAERLEARGAVRVHGAAWTPYGGWIAPPEDAPRGWGVTRRTLDPMLRDLAAETPGVELMTGRTATRLLADVDGRPGGVEVTTKDRQTSAVHARLVVGADGRHSKVARLARVPGRTRPNNRIAYFAYWEGVRPMDDLARVWMLDPEAAAHFPNEDGIAMLTAVPHRSRADEFKTDLEGAYRRWFDALPDGPDLSEATRVSKVMGVLDHANVIRPAARNGVAFVGDAAVAADPLFGVGLSWAFQSAEWLADHTAPALLDGGDLDRALGRYRRTVMRQLGLHYLAISEFSSARRLYPWERAASRAAVHDVAVARAFDEVASRRRSPLRILDPRLAAGVARALIAG